ncbi:max-binding protein MNT-like isoform X2 [Amphibalanus amphitrite]|uniref:max-binding protein MNT-like isoform X2 n=1 Tax=Amphibalanus amphitrite TaxID=1232801 RepID=UPI001C9141E5|nr:max-binding protein MNT-like isoform X2 [Amphibalanus amphitrite]
MGVADTVHRSVTCPPKKKWINAYKQDEDSRDDVSFAPAGRHQAPVPPSARHQPGAPAVTPPPPQRSPRTPSAFIATHHSYVRTSGAVAAPAGPPAAPQPAAHPPPSAGAAAALSHRSAVQPGAAHEHRNGVLPMAPAPPAVPTYRYDSSDDIQDRKGRVSAGTREVHNKLEKNRRAHLKECFENLRRQVPVLDEKRTSNLGILRGALRYIGTLKRKERECEHEMERLAREKIANQQRLAQLKRDLSAKWDHIDFSQLLPDPTANNDNDSNSTLSATESRLDGDSYQASPERELEPPSPEPRRRPAERPAAASPAYLGHSSGYSSSSPTVAASAPPLGGGGGGQPAGLARLAAMASSQQKMLSSGGHKVSVVQTTAAETDGRGRPDTDAQLLHAEHGVQYVPVTALSEVGRPPATVSYVEQPLDASRKALVLETVPGHIVNAQLMSSAAGTVRLSSAGVPSVQLTAAPSSLQVLTPAGVRLVAAPGPAHHASGSAVMATTSGGAQRSVLTLPPRTAVPLPRAETAPSAGKVAAVSGLTQLVSSPLPRLVTQPVTHLVASAAPATMTVLGQSKVVKQLPVISPYITTASQAPSRPMVVVSAAGLLPVTKH